MNRIFGAVVGQSGTGKSYFIKKKLIPLYAGKLPIVIIDKMDEYNRLPGQVTFRNFDSFIDALAKVGRLNPKKIYVLKINSDDFLILAIHFLRAAEAKMLVIIEEAHDLFTDPEIAKAVKVPLKQLTMYGRHFRTNIVMTSQRQGDLAPYLRSQFQFIISFNLTDRTDLKYMQEFNYESVEKIKNLKQYKYTITGPTIPDEFKNLN
jgi:DNA helicase HerA-like ATPase